MNTILSKRFHPYIFIVSAIYLLISCKPIATQFEGTEDARYYITDEMHPIPQPDSSIKVMTWNIRFGIGRTPWFGDACGDNVVFSKNAVMPHLQTVVNRINEIHPDILMLQEVDINSTRTNYLNELQYILDNTYFNYAAYVPEWEAQFIPSDGLGKMNMGLVILSPWPISNAKRIQLALRTDQSSIEVYFYLRSCIVSGNIHIPGFKEFSVLNMHASAFSTDDTKQKHYEQFKAELDKINNSGGYFVAGGDFNTIPPGSDSTDFCEEDKCPDESFHQTADKPLHKSGSDYTQEKSWLLPIYAAYKCAVPLTDYQSNQSAYFSHTTRPEHNFDRTLDYLFTNYYWVANSTITHQEAFYDSDHAPVSSIFLLPK